MREAAVHMLSWSLVAAAFGAGTNDSQSVTLTSRSFTEGSGAARGSSSVTIRREAGRARLIEERKEEGGEHYRFDLQLDPATFEVLAWTRTSGEGADAARTELRIAEGRIETRTFVGGKEKGASSLPVPAGVYAVAPMMRYGLMRLVENKAVPGEFFNVTVSGQGALKAIAVSVEDLGETTVTVPAGEFKCRHLRLAPKSSMLSLVVPPGEMYVATIAGHPAMVKARMAPTRASGHIITELQSCVTAPAKSP